MQQQHARASNLKFANLCFAVVDLCRGGAEGPHSGTGLTCDQDTYHRRLWCRVELFSHYFRRGRDAMYLLQEDQVLASVDQSWLLDALFVFEGDCTCCLRKHEGMKCDKLNIFEDLIVQSERRCVQETYIFGSSFSDVQSEGECLSMLLPSLASLVQPVCLSKLSTDCLISLVSCCMLHASSYLCSSVCFC